MENGKLTINSVLQALMLGCLGLAFVGKQSKGIFSFCHKLFVKKPDLVTEIINSIEEICHQILEN